MKIFTKFGIAFYTFILSVVGALLIAYALKLLPLELVNTWLSFVQDNSQTRIILGLIGALLILVSFSFAQLILGTLEREKTIAFTNPAGRVTIALSAVESLIVRLLRVIPEIKEARPDVIAGKKGIEIDLRLILRSEVNLPNLTLQLQEMIKNKVQEMLGIEEQITVKLHVAKIISSEEKDKKRKDSDKEEPPFIPFSGYSKI